MRTLSPSLVSGLSRAAFLGIYAFLELLVVSCEIGSWRFRFSTSALPVPPIACSTLLFSVRARRERAADTQPQVAGIPAIDAPPPDWSLTPLNALNLFRQAI